MVGGLGFCGCSISTPICAKCCKAKGILYRCDTMSLRQRAQASVIRLTAKLAMTYPRKGIWGKAPLARRSRYEAALREAELRVAMYAKRSRKKLAKELEPPPEPTRIKRPNRRAVHPRIKRPEHRQIVRIELPTSRHDRPNSII